MEPFKQKLWKNTFINDIQSYLEWLNEIKTNINDAGTDKTFELEIPHIYYRGQADRHWNLIPAVFRENYDEGSLLREAQRQCWSELYGLKSWTEKIILLQHYGLPTRLLDVTFNPFVALYFACCSHKDRIGAVYCGYNNEPSYASEIAENISCLVCNQPYGSEMSSNSIYIDTPDHRYYEPFLIYPPLNNPRLAAQNGAFIMTPLAKIENTYSSKLLQHQCFDNRRAVICPKRKEEILRQLSTFGFDRGSIFVSFADRLTSIAENELLTNKYLPL